LTESAGGLYAEISELASSFDRSTAQGLATIFGVCARALAPLLEKVEQRSGGSWSVPDLPLALDLIEEFASGTAASADHGALQERLRVETPDDHPWGTYADDVLVCTEAGLEAAMSGGRPKSTLIYYALEPLKAFLENRDAAMIRQYGLKYWERKIVGDPAMLAALEFLRGMIREVSQAASVDSREFSRLVSAGTVLRPPNTASRRMV
jgi:hypothetical protein